MDNELTSKITPMLKELLTCLKQIAISTNIEWAKKLGIPPSTAITCVKPSGSVSQLANCSSGIHPRWSNYYVRTIRCSTTDPVGKLLIDSHVPYVMDKYTQNTYVFCFPIKSPDKCIVRDTLDTIDHLNLWLVYQEYWCEHKPSVTINVRENEWYKVADWVYNNFDKISGISFMPYDMGTYENPPYSEIKKNQYDELIKKKINVNWDKLTKYEKSDHTTGSHELACTANACELT